LNTKLFEKLLVKITLLSLVKVMDGILNLNVKIRDMKKFNIYFKIVYGVKIFVIAIIFSSCISKTSNENSTKIEQLFLQDNFLSMVDTFAYVAGNFSPLPPMINKPIVDTVYTNLSIELVDSIAYDKSSLFDINSFFNSNTILKTRFQDIIKSKDFMVFKLDSNFQKKIGRYHIYLNKKYENKMISYAGMVKFSNFKILNNKAFLEVSQTYDRGGRSYIVLFEKENNVWKVIKKEILVYY
jgi:hypothetical protein